MRTLQRSGRINVGSAVCRLDAPWIVGTVEAIHRGRAQVRWTPHTQTWVDITALNRGKHPTIGRSLGYAKLAQLRRYENLTQC